MTTQPITLDQVIPLVKQLSLSDQAGLITVITTTLQQQLAELAPNRLNDEEKVRQARVRALRGKYAHIRTSSEDFARAKQAEIELEERRWPS